MMKFKLLPIPLLAAFCGGLTDVYTYLNYHVLAAAQTGNLVFMSNNIADGDFVDILQKLLAYIAFVIGVLLGEVVESRQYPRWLLILPLFCTSMISPHLPATLAIPLFTASAGILTADFSQIDHNHFNMMFMTGNTRNAIIDWLHARKSPTPVNLLNAQDYRYILASFLLGTICSAFMHWHFPMQAHWLISTCCLLMWVKVRKS